MENQHTCKLCNRTFPNGRSLGGHMRSHSIHPQPLTPPLSPPTRRLQLTESTSPSFSATSSEDGGDATRDTSSYGLRENPKRSLRLVDWESESDSSKVSQVTRPRSTRSRRRLAPVASDQDLALCLMMLSRDHWIRPVKEEEGRDLRSFQNSEVEEACGGSLQKKARSKKRAIHQCPVCYRVFATGQALGGHKRAHFTAINTDEKKNDEVEGNSWRLTSIDLNLPPPDQNQEDELKS